MGMKIVKERKTRVTLKDLAKATGLAVPTVSRIINKKETYCSHETRTQVLQLARKLNYQPNIGYRIMTGMETNIAGIIFSQERLTRDEHILVLLTSLNLGLETRDYAVYSTVLTPDADQNMVKIRGLEAKGCRSFVFVGAPIGYDRIADYIYESGHQYIGINYHDLKKVVWLNEGGAIISYLRYFRETGSDDFKIVVPPLYLEERLCPEMTTFDQDYCKNKWHWIELDEFPVRDHFDQSFALGYQVASAEYRKNPNIQGLIFISDYHALGAARFFSEQGLRVGEDVKLCGMFNTSTRRFSNMSIISSEFKMRDVGELMLDNLSMPAPILINIEPEIIINKEI
jgi:DNA-binding LacI/PurR family transcriptional regulator